MSSRRPPSRSPRTATGGRPTTTGIEHTIRGASITILERRPPWNPAYGSEWSSMTIAQLRYDEPTRRWRLYAAGSDDRWRAYEFAAPAADIARLLDAIEQDRAGIFWG
jgi:hypothetical protein